MGMTTCSQVIICLRLLFSSVFHKHTVFFFLPRYIPILKPLDLPNMNSCEPMGGNLFRDGQISIEKGTNLLSSRYGASLADESFIGIVNIGVISG